MPQNIQNTKLLLKYTYGILPIVTGLDKLFFNIIAQWESYLAPFISDTIISASILMPIVGVLEIIAGIIVLSKYTRIGAYIISVWLLLISINLIILGAYDIALRDIVMAIGAFALAQLTVTN